MEGKWDVAFLETILKALEAVPSLQVPVGDGAPVPPLSPGVEEQDSPCAGPLEGLGECHPADTERWWPVAYDSCWFPAKATGCKGRAGRRPINIEL